jgi:hypothetical protein
MIFASFHQGKEERIQPFLCHSRITIVRVRTIGRSRLIANKPLYTGTVATRAKKNRESSLFI